MAVTDNSISDWQRMEYEDAFRVYCIYMAIKLHFTSPSFNYAEYGPMTNYKFETFYAKEGQRKQFGRLARRFHHDEECVIENYIISNFVVNQKTWVTHLLTKQGEHHYQQWRQLYENFTYNFARNCEENLFPLIREHGIPFMEYLKPKSPDVHTKLMEDIITKKIPVWFLIAIHKVTGFLDAYDNMYRDNVFWQAESSFLRKVDQVVVDEDRENTRKKLRELILLHGV